MNDIEKLVRETLATDRSDIFAAGFADRTIARWKREQPPLNDVVSNSFKRIIPFAAAAAIALGFYNVTSNSNASTIDRLLGLTTVTVDAAYDFGGMQ